MKTFIIVSLLSLTLASCNTESESKSSTATINGMSADNAFSPSMLKTKGNCAEGDFTAQYVTFDTIELFIQKNGNALAHYFDDNKEQWESVTWKYEGTELVFNNNARISIINYNGENTPFLKVEDITVQGQQSKYDQQNSDLSCEDFVAHIDSLL